jgi:hypothetical protein
MALSNGRSEQVDAIKLLKTQHDEVEALFMKFEKTEKAEEKLEIFKQVADNLAAHATIEEKVFYPAAYGEGEEDLEDLLREAVEEHLGMKRVIADLLEMKPSDENFDAKMNVLKELVEHHVEEEESELFADAKKAIPSEELEVMGAEMEEMFKALIAGEPRMDVPAETDEAAPLQ